jgi:undecaprenyl diphosphate synthase
MEEEELKERLDPQRIPRHIAMIMDGNGRWAQKHGKHRFFGHSQGVESVRDSLIGASESGVEYLTLYAFSTENWRRPRQEIDALMDLLVQTVLKEVEELNRNGVRLRTIGDLDRLPESCRDSIQEAKDRTRENDRVDLVLALSYSSRWEITEMARSLAEKAQKGELDPADIDEAKVEEELHTHDIPDPDLLIRTSGERRISNYLLWQLAYAELYFTETLWPDFRKKDLFEAILDYQGRERRFGRISEQEPHENFS